MHTTEIRINEYGDEVHESWLLVRANRITSGPPGHRLFDSEIWHHHFIRVSITRASRKRQLNHDWLHNEQVLMEFDLSQAQWGAFVSSFGDGSGVPATLQYLIQEGNVPQAPVESRFEQSYSEVHGAASKALSDVQKKYDEARAIFDSNGGRKALRASLDSLKYALRGVPNNMVFTTESMAEAAEEIVTKAQADIESAVAMAAARHPELEQAPLGTMTLLEKPK